VYTQITWNNEGKILPKSSDSSSLLISSIWSITFEDIGPSKFMASGELKLWKSWKLKLLCVLCQLFAGGLVICVPIYCLFLSYVFPASNIFNLRFTTFLTIYIWLNLFANWVIFKRKLYSCGILECASSGSLTCSEFSSLVPQGTHHCPICDVCVWRRDHHCFFLGGCVGSCNLNNFYSFCFNTFIGCSYAQMLIVFHLNAEFKEIWSSDFTFYIFPFTAVQWLIGRVSNHHFFAVLLLSLIFATALSTLFMLLFQSYLIFVSKTSYEYFCGTNVASLQSWRNFEQTLGTNWPINLFVPRMSGTLNVRKRNLACSSSSVDWEAMKYVWKWNWFGICTNLISKQHYWAILSKSRLFFFVLQNSIYIIN